MPLFKGLSSKSTPKKAIAYITREDKAAFVSVRNLFEDEDYAKQFADMMQRFGKSKKFVERKYYNFKLSCARKDNVRPEQAHLYAEELAAILFDLENSLLKEALAISNDKCNSLIDKQNMLIKDLTMKVRVLESENDYNANSLSESVSSAVVEIKSLQTETCSLNNRVATETSNAIKRATTTLENELRKSIAVQSQEVFAEVKKELNESKKLLESTREELKVERGFRKLLFWATPILLLTQTIAIILTAL